MRGPTRIVWVILTPFSVQLLLVVVLLCCNTAVSLWFSFVLRSFTTSLQVPGVIRTIITSQCRSTTPYQVSYHIQSLLS